MWIHFFFLFFLSPVSNFIALVGSFIKAVGKQFSVFSSLVGDFTSFFIAFIIGGVESFCSRVYWVCYFFVYWFLVTYIFFNSLSNGLNIFFIVLAFFLFFLFGLWGFVKVFYSFLGF